MNIKVGMTFNHKGITWKVTNAGKTESKVVAVTKSEKGKETVIDNKIITKAKPTNEGVIVETKRMQQLAGLSEGKMSKQRDADSVMMDLEDLIEEAWEALKYKWGEEGTDEVSYRKAEKAFNAMHKEFLKIEKEM